MTQSIAQQLLEIFGGNNYHSQFHHATDRSKAGWFPKHNQPLTEELIQQHLDGELILGAYTVLADDGTVRWIAWDVDVSNDDENGTRAQEITTEIVDAIAPIEPIVERSGGKGYHIFLVFETPIPAKEAKEFAEAVRDKLGFAKSGLEHVECFPKKAENIIVDESTFRPGTLIKIPLGVHPSTKARSTIINITDGWSAVPIEDSPDYLGKRISFSTVIEKVSTQGNAISRMVAAIANDWSDGVRHEMALAISGFLISAGWSDDQVENLIRQVCEKTGDEDVENRVEAVHTTAKKWAEGKSIVGFSKLNELMRKSNLQVLLDNYETISTSPLAQQIRQIRLKRGREEMKRSKIARLIWTSFTEADTGIFINVPLDRTSSDGPVQHYWLDKKTRQLHKCVPGGTWSDVVYDRTSLVDGERFTNLILKELTYIVHNSLELSLLHRRSYFNPATNILYLHLGGVIVYKLDGSKIEQIYNGDENVFFDNLPIEVLDQESGKRKLVIPENQGIDCWDHLIDGIEIEPNVRVTMSEPMQIEVLKAWILSFFFGTIMKTRPILTFLGDPGSGKTTATRRIIRFIDGPESDVSSPYFEKADALPTMLVNNMILALDNLEESKSAGDTVNHLDRASTGGTIRMRSLFTTVDEVRYAPDVFLILTAVQFPFSKETLFQRMLPIRLKKIPEGQFESEYVIQERLQTALPGMWHDMMLKLNQCVASIREFGSTMITSNTRMADFSRFCTAIESAGVLDNDLISQAMTTLNVAQNEAQSSSRGSAYETVSKIITTKPDIWAEGEINLQIVYKYAKQFGYVADHRTFTNELQRSAHRLKQEFGFEMEETRPDYYIVKCKKATEFNQLIQAKRSTQSGGKSSVMTTRGRGLKIGPSST